MDRTCAKCHRVFAHPYLLARHARRKTTCVAAAKSSPAAVHTCDRCGSTYQSASNLRRHMRSRHSAPEAATELAMAPPGPGLSSDILAYLKDPMVRAALQLLLTANIGTESQPTAAAAEASAPAVADAAPSQLAATDRGVIQQVAVNNGTVVLNIFGQENTDHITRDDIRSLLTEVMTAANRDIAAVVRMAMMIYSDPTKPENITCYMPNRREASAMVYGTEGWEMRPVSMVMPPMINRSLDVLFAKQPLAGKIEPFVPILRDLMAGEESGELASRLLGAGSELRVLLSRNKTFIAGRN